MNEHRDHVVTFRRTAWSTTIDSGDEANHPTLWSGPAARVAQFKLEVKLDRVDAAYQVTPHAVVSNDGEVWTSVAWVGTPPVAMSNDGMNTVGPFRIDPFHGKALMRIVLKVEAPSGTGLVYLQASGRLTLFDAERVDVDVSGGSYVAGDGLDLTGTTFSVAADVARSSGTGIDNRLARWDGTTNVQGSLVEVDDLGNVKSDGVLRLKEQGAVPSAVNGYGTLWQDAAASLLYVDESGSKYIVGGSAAGAHAYLERQTGQDSNAYTGGFNCFGSNFGGTINSKVRACVAYTTEGKVGMWYPGVYETSANLLLLVDTGGSSTAANIAVSLLRWAPGWSAIKTVLVRLYGVGGTAYDPIYSVSFLHVHSEPGDLILSIDGGGTSIRVMAGSSWLTKRLGGPY